MADGYTPYIPEELPLNNPTNKRREREIEASSYEATRPATMGAVNESLLASMVDDSATSSAFFDDVVGYSMGSLNDIIEADNRHHVSKPTVYDDEYGSSAAAAAGQQQAKSEGAESSNDDNSNSTDGDNHAQSEEFIQEKEIAVDRGELSGPATVTPIGKDGQRDSFADADEGLPPQNTEDYGRGTPDALESHVLGLNNLMTLRSQRIYDWRPSNSEVEYTSEMELFVEDGDDGDGSAADDFPETTNPKRISNDEMMMDGPNLSMDVERSPGKPTSTSSNISNPEDPAVPMDIASIKGMKKEDYWELFNNILHKPTDFVPEDPLEFVKRRDAARRERAIARQSSPKPKRQRPRRGKSVEGPTRSRSVEVFEPPNMKQRPRAPRRSSSFNGTTEQELRSQNDGPPNNQNGQHSSILSKLPFMQKNTKFHRPKKPVFVAMMEHKTQEFGRKAREATLSFSSKFHATSTKNIENGE
ncbi:MAG: hypothetical protein SGBAC_011682 [Bacillariaceae sp.]